MAEVWRDIDGYDGKYLISDRGRVMSMVGNSKILKPRLRSGYPSVILSGPDGKKNHCVHDLVMAAFAGPKPDGMVVRHLNGDRQDNRAENLRYGTHKENQADRKLHGTEYKGRDHHFCKLTEKQVYEIREARSGIRKLHEAYGISRAAVDAIRSRRNWGWLPERECC